MTTQIIVKASAIGLHFMACCDYSPADEGGPDEPPTPSECIVSELSVNVGGMWLDCTWMLDSDVADQITDAIEVNSDAVARADSDERKTDAVLEHAFDSAFDHAMGWS